MAVQFKKPKVAQFQTKIEQSLINRFLRIMDLTVGNIENEVFYPNHNSMFCGKKCSYYQVCMKEW